jgi:ABC-type arginine/histidine transport system permease subunit
MKRRNPLSEEEKAAARREALTLAVNFGIGRCLTAKEVSEVAELFTMFLLGTPTH